MPAPATKQTHTPDPKRAKLMELASTRVPKAIRAMGLVGNLIAYKPTEAQKTAILGALEQQLKVIRTRYAGTVPEEPAFKLPE